MQAGRRILVKAAITLAFIWMMLPREPDMEIPGPSQPTAVYSVEHIRQVVFDVVIRVRADLKVHRFSM